MGSRFISSAEKSANGKVATAVFGLLSRHETHTTGSCRGVASCRALSRPVAAGRGLSRHAATCPDGALLALCEQRAREEVAAEFGGRRGLGFCMVECWRGEDMCDGSTVGRVGARSSWKGEEVCGLSRRLLTIVAAPAAGAWICLAEPAKMFRAVSGYNDDEIAEQEADGVIGAAALSLFRRRLMLLLLHQVPVKLVIFTHRNQQ